MYLKLRHESLKRLNSKGAQYLPVPEVRFPPVLGIRHKGCCQSVRSLLLSDKRASKGWASSQSADATEERLKTQSPEGIHWPRVKCTQMAGTAIPGCLLNKRGKKWQRMALSISLCLCGVREAFTLSYLRPFQVTLLAEQPLRVTDAAKCAYVCVHPVHSQHWWELWQPCGPNVRICLRANKINVKILFIFMVSVMRETELEKEKRNWMEL